MQLLNNKLYLNAITGGICQCVKAGKVIKLTDVPDIFCKSYCCNKHSANVWYDANKVANKCGVPPVPIIILRPLDPIYDKNKYTVLK